MRYRGWCLCDRCAGFPGKNASNTCMGRLDCSNGLGVPGIPGISSMSDVECLAREDHCRSSAEHRCQAFRGVASEFGGDFVPAEVGPGTIPTRGDEGRAARMGRRSARPTPPQGVDSQSARRRNSGRASVSKYLARRSRHRHWFPTCRVRSLKLCVRPPTQRCHFSTSSSTTTWCPRRRSRSGRCSLAAAAVWIRAYPLPFEIGRSSIRTFSKKPFGVLPEF